MKITIIPKKAKKKGSCCFTGLFTNLHYATLSEMGNKLRFISVLPIQRMVTGMTDTKMKMRMPPLITHLCSCKITPDFALIMKPPKY